MRHRGVHTPDHREWTYLPGSRAGLSLREMDDAQRRLAIGCWGPDWSAPGLATAATSWRWRRCSRDLEREAGKPGWQRRHPGHFWVRVLGTPDARAPWAWRVNGHHLAVHLTLVGDEVAGTPQFFGANPAVVKHGPQRAAHPAARGGPGARPAWA